MGAEDFRDYLVQEGQRQQAAQRFADITSDPAEVAADLERSVENSSGEQVSRIAEQAEAAESDLSSLVTDARDLHGRIGAGTLTVDEAREALTGLRERHGRTTALVSSLKPRYDSAVRDVKDPAARRDELLDKYPSLRR